MKLLMTLLKCFVLEHSVFKTKHLRLRIIFKKVQPSRKIRLCLCILKCVTGYFLFNWPSYGEFLAHSFINQTKYNQQVSWGFTEFTMKIHAAVLNMSNSGKYLESNVCWHILRKFIEVIDGFWHNSKSKGYFKM